MKQVMQSPGQMTYKMGDFFFWGGGGVKFCPYKNGGRKSFTHAEGRAQQVFR